MHLFLLHHQSFVVHDPLVVASKVLSDRLRVSRRRVEHESAHARPHLRTVRFGVGASVGVGFDARRPSMESRGVEDGAHGSGADAGDDEAVDVVFRGERLRAVAESDVDGKRGRGGRGVAGLDRLAGAPDVLAGDVHFRRASVDADGGVDASAGDEPEREETVTAPQIGGDAADGAVGDHAREKVHADGPRRGGHPGGRGPPGLLLRGAVRRALHSEPRGDAVARAVARDAAVSRGATRRRFAAHARAADGGRRGRGDAAARRRDGHLEGTVVLERATRRNSVETRPSRASSRTRATMSQRGALVDETRRRPLDDDHGVVGKKRATFNIHAPWTERMEV